MKNNLYINFMRFALLALLLSAGRTCFSQSYLPLTGDKNKDCLSTKPA